MLNNKLLSDDKKDISTPQSKCLYLLEHKHEAIDIYYSYELAIFNTDNQEWIIVSRGHLKVPKKIAEKTISRKWNLTELIGIGGE